MESPWNGSRDTAAARVEGWAREVARLDDATRVRVEERACALSGWPQVESVISIETAAGVHEHRIHKGLARVTRLDVVAIWRSGDACCGP